MSRYDWPSQRAEPTYIIIFRGIYMYDRIVTVSFSCCLGSMHSKYSIGTNASCAFCAQSADTDMTVRGSAMQRLPETHN